VLVLHRKLRIDSESSDINHRGIQPANCRYAKRQVGCRSVRKQRLSRSPIACTNAVVHLWMYPKFQNLRDPLKRCPSINLTSFDFKKSAAVFATESFGPVPTFTRVVFITMMGTLAVRRGRQRYMRQSPHAHLEQRPLIQRQFRWFVRG
jgi:hypothetical protein